MTGQNCEEVIICGDHIFGPSGRVPFKIASCSSYHPSNIAWLYEMKEIAWKVEARKRGPAGFTNPDTTEMEIVITAPSNTPDQCPD